MDNITRDDLARIVTLAEPPIENKGRLMAEITLLARKAGGENVTVNDDVFNALDNETRCFLLQVYLSIITQRLK